MTTVNDFTDILRSIREQPEWGEALRSALLSKEVLELPQRLAEFSEAANKRFDRLESDVAELKAGQARLEGDVAEVKAGQARLESTVSLLQGQVGNLRGSSYQLNVKTKIASIVTQRLGLDDIRVLKGSLAADDNAFFRLLLNAVTQGVISEQETGRSLKHGHYLAGAKANPIKVCCTWCWKFQLQWPETTSPVLMTEPAYSRGPSERRRSRP